MRHNLNHDETWVEINNLKDRMIAHNVAPEVVEYEVRVGTHTAELHTKEVCAGSWINMQAFKEGFESVADKNWSEKAECEDIEQVKRPHYERGRIFVFG